MRIIINDDSVRKEFFQLVKLSLNENWVEVGKKYNILRQTFDRYRSGKTSIPEELFEKLIEFLQNKDRKRVELHLKKIPNNIGQVIGGRKAYRKNFKEFEKGRIKGLLAIKKYQNSGLGKKQIKFSEIKLTENLCEVIGAFIGDGFFNSYNNRTYQIEFSGDSRYDLKYYQEKIIPTIKNVVPSVNPHILKVKNKNCIRVIFYSKELFILLKDYFGFNPGPKTHNVVIPEKIIDSGNENLINSTIRGIFDTDGCVFFDRRSGYKKPYPRICLQMCSKQLIEQIYNHLSKHFNMSKKENISRNIGILEIYGHSQMKKWMSLVGFSNKRHLDRIASVA